MNDQLMLRARNMATAAGEALGTLVAIADALETALKERDTARAQVETLAMALRWYAANAGAVSWDCDSGSRAQAALKAAGVET